MSEPVVSDRDHASDAQARLATELAGPYTCSKVLSYFYRWLISQPGTAAANLGQASFRREKRVWLAVYNIRSIWQISDLLCQPC